LFAATAASMVCAPALAADKVRLVNSTKVVFETEHPYAAKEAGIFKKYGLDVSVIHGSGGAASLQAVLTGSQDVVWGNGVLGVLSAYSRGAPVRILGSNIRGVGDLYWYVKTNSAIKKFTDLKEGQEFAYSRPGSTTNLATIYIKKALGLKAKLVSVGGPSGSRTQLMSGQVATGWSVFPLGKGLLRENKIRIIGTGSAAEGLNGVTIRVIAANSRWLDKNRNIARRLMNALEEGRYRTYTSDAQMKAYAKRWKLNFDDVKDSSKDVPLVNSTFLPVARLDVINQIALENKKLKKLLTAKQLHELVHPMGNKPL
jgi:NitT/TauT family transport system substrate-binding protein